MKGLTIASAIKYVDKALISIDRTEINVKH